jgi:AbrB family looped-hinge helix DNA binding protein
MRAYRFVVGARGQVTIPAALRKQLGIKNGTGAVWINENGRLILAPMTMRHIKGMKGFLKPRPGEPSMFEEIFAERKRERNREK